jgi:hypothetical protein
MTISHSYLGVKFSEDEDGEGVDLEYSVKITYNVLIVPKMDSARHSTCINPFYDMKWQRVDIRGQDL